MDRNCSHMQRVRVLCVCLTVCCYLGCAAACDMMLPNIGGGDIVSLNLNVPLRRVDKSVGSISVAQSRSVTANSLSPYMCMLTSLFSTGLE